MIKSCHQCGSELTCSSDGSGCWCEGFPPILPVSEKVDCMCPTCLKQRINLAIDTYAQNVSDGKIVNNAHQYDTPELVEGIDYYLENNFWVFTKWYHLKRGSCCGNKCRHCPFDHENVQQN